MPDDSNAGDAEVHPLAASAAAAAVLSGPAHAITAAGRKIDLATRDGRKLIRKPSGWQDDAWVYFDVVPEVKFAARYQGGALSRLRMYPGVVIDPDSPPVAVEDLLDATGDGRIPERVAEIARDEWSRVANSTGGQAALQQQWGILLPLVGDSYIVAQPMEDDPTVEEWNVYSADAFKVRGESVFLCEDPGDTKGRELPADTLFYRIWVRHPRWPGQADSNMRAVLATCEELLMGDRQFRSSMASRANNGLLLAPSEIDFVKQPVLAAGPQTKADSDDGLTAFERNLMWTLLDPIETDGSAAAVVPLLIRAKGELLQYIRHLSLDRPIDAQLVPRMEYLMTRLAHGLDIPQERLTGMGDVNHWGAWQIGDDEYKAHVEPLAQVPAAAMAAVFLRPAVRLRLLEVGASEEELSWVPRLVLGIDPSGLVSRPNRAVDARDAFDRFAIGWSALRKYLGFPDTDAPDDAEIAARQQLTGSAYGLGGTGGMASPVNGGEATPAAPASARALVASSASATTIGGSLAEIDDRLRDRLTALASSALNDALRRAGNRLRAKAQSTPHESVVKGVKAEDVGRTLGAAASASLTDPDALLAGAWDDLSGQWDSLVGQAQEAVASLLAARADEIGSDAAESAVSGYRSRSGSRRAAGLAVLLGLLGGVAKERLFTSGEAIAAGESSAVFSVPQGIIRDALSVVGGGDDTANVPVGSAGPGGLTAGPDVLDVLAASGLLVQGWEWTTGDPTVPFEPHQNLAGFAFTSWQDETLVNSDSFPPYGYYWPGDHLGCQCSAIPALVEVDAGSVTAGDVPSEDTEAA